jgi:neutral amino acid transport system permease protein
MDILGILGDGFRAAIGPEAAVYALAAIGLNIHFGYTGLLNFGQVAFMLVGAYGVAISVSVWGLPMAVGLVLGILCAVVLALLLGIPTLRLRSDYLAIATIAAAEVLRYVYRSSASEPVTGGVFGLTRFADGFYELNPLPRDRYGFGNFVYSERTLWVMIVGWMLVALACLLVYLLIHSPWGRVLRSIREDEDAVRSLGKNVYGYKMQSLVLGGVFGAVAGALLAVSTQSVQPDGYDPKVTFYLYTLLILGGAGQVFGPVLGSIIFWFVLVLFDSLLREGIASGTITFLEPSDIGGMRFALVGLGLMVLMLLRPQGILGNRKELALDAR